MKRLDKNRIDLIRKLSKTHSLNKIYKKLGLSKSVTYYWYRKFVGPKYKKVEFNPQFQEDLGEIIGIFSSDGYYYAQKNSSYRTRIYLSRKQYNYALKIKDLFNKCFNKVGSIYKHKENMFIFNIYGKEIIEIFKNYISWKGKKAYTIKLLSPTNKYSKKFLRGFLKGLFYGDGWTTNKNTGFGSVSWALSQNFSEILTLFKIDYYLRKDKRKGKRTFYVIMIPASEKIKFLKLVDYERNAPAGTFR